MENTFNDIIDILINNSFLKKNTSLQFYDENDTLIAKVSNTGFNSTKMVFESSPQDEFVAGEKKTVDIKTLSTLLSNIKTKKAVLLQDGKKPIPFYSEL